MEAKCLGVDLLGFILGVIGLRYLFGIDAVNDLIKVILHILCWETCFRNSRNAKLSPAYKVRCPWQQSSDGDRCCREGNLGKLKVVAVS